MPTETPPPISTPTPTPALAVGSTRVREKDSMVMVYVPGGTFQMGSTEGNADEQPVHPVTLDGFWIDQTKVTNAQYARCVEEGECNIPPQLGSDEYPVVDVSWNDATTYCGWAGGQLPTEAEWEYAARGPDGHIYPWGNDPPDDTLLNYNGNVGNYTKVGSYPKGQSWVGAMDMAGNVLEWVNDWYASYPSGPQVNPAGPASGQDRVLRGSYFYVVEEIVRAARRDHEPPDYHHFLIGFRCAVGPGG